jgi:NurA-like 5'-3' nuclease
MIVLLHYPEDDSPELFLSKWWTDALQNLENVSKSAYEHSVPMCDLNKDKDIFKYCILMVIPLLTLIMKSSQVYVVGC